MSGPTTTQHDVVVVGARCAGAATALLLARRGLRVLLVDRAPHGSDTLSTHALMRGGVVQLHRWGVLDAVIAAGTPPVRTTTFDYADDRVVVPIKPAAGFDALYAPRRTVLDRILVDAAVAAGSAARYGVAVTDVVRERDGRVVGVVGRDQDGAPFEARARFVVGADGVRSQVARQVGAPVTHLGAAASSVVYGYWSGLDVEGYEWCFHDGAAAGFIPTNDDEVCVFASGRAVPFAGGVAVRERWYARQLRRAAPGAVDRLAAATHGPLRAYTGTPGWLRTPAGPGWALVGDAGAYRDPITAHGISDALRDAELAAEAIAAALCGGPAEEATALAAYAATRDAVAAPILDVTDRVATYRWDGDEIRSLHLDLSAALAAEVDLLRAVEARSSVAAAP